jgi:hypothetical protein
MPWREIDKITEFGSAQGAHPTRLELMDDKASPNLANELYIAAITMESC